MILKKNLENAIKAKHVDLKSGVIFIISFGFWDIKIIFVRVYFDVSAKQPYSVWLNREKTKQKKVEQKKILFF